jgi:5-methyltetrahydrofolate--homocysteine methyltransferase
MDTTFVGRLNAGETLVADGATATNYQQMGMEIGVAPEEWVVDEEDKVRGLHQAFVDAGSDIILTNSFGGTALRLKDSRYAGQVRRLNRRAAQLARQAASRPGVLVAGSMGPTGLLMQPFGDLTHSVAADVYAEQAASLAEGGVDLLLLETFFALEEAMAAIDGVRRASALPLVVSFSFDQGVRTMMGLSPATMIAALAPLGLAAIGANCGRSLADMEKVVGELAAAKAGIPLWIKPNAGLPRMVGDVARYDTTPETMADYACRFLAAGARIVGGCCGSTPGHVGAIAEAVGARKINPTRLGV